MQKVILLIVLSILCLNVFAGRSHLTCSKNGTNIIFINGVNVKTSEYRNFVTDARAVFEVLKANFADAKSTLYFEPLYNTSEGQARDVAETMFLYIESLSRQSRKQIPVSLMIRIIAAGYLNLKKFWKPLCEDPGDPTIKQVCSEYFKLKETYYSSLTYRDLGKITQALQKSLADDKKVLFITHSAGAMFADKARDYVDEYYSDHKDYIGHIALARPLPSKHKGFILNSSGDAFLSFLRSKSINVPKNNVKFSTDCPGYPGGPVQESAIPHKNHAFACYASDILITPDTAPKFSSGDISSKGYIADLTYQASSFLENNDDNCCNKQRGGKVWSNYGIWNGGFVSKNVQVLSGNIEVHTRAQLCGEGAIIATENGANHVFGDDTVLEGKFRLNSPFKFVCGVKTSKQSELTSSFHSERKLNVCGMTLDGQLSANMSGGPEGNNEDYVQIYQSNFGPSLHRIEGNVKVSGSVFDGMSELKSTNGKIEVYDVKSDEGAFLIARGAGKLQKISFSKGMKITSPRFQINNSNFFDLFETSAPVVSVLATEFLSESKVIAGESIVFSSPSTVGFNKYYAVNGNCSGAILFDNNLKRFSMPLTLSNCKNVTFQNVEINGPLAIEGSVILSGKFNLGGSIKINQSYTESAIGLSMKVEGVTNVNAPNGLGFFGSDVILPGNFNVSSDCSKKAWIGFYATPPGNFSYYFSSTGKATLTCTETDGNFQCHPSDQDC